MTVIALDNRGSGKSSRPNYPYTMDMFVEDLKSLLSYLNIKDKIHLCGISMGGMIAQNFVLKYPKIVKTLTLVATSPNAKTETKFLLNLREKSKNNNPELEFKNLLPLLFTKTFIKALNKDEILNERIKEIFMGNPARLQDRVNQGAVIIKDHNTRQLLHTIEVPTLITVGSKDYFVSHAKLLHDGIKDSRLEIIEGFGHGFFIEAADRLNGVLWNFIKEFLE